ncbi:MAG TPA: hypothetical protein DGU45_04765 [Planctomycetes bacterium]|nr:hypothetical protein [Planctomycetota bacterium]
MFTLSMRLLGFQFVASQQNRSRRSQTSTRDEVILRTCRNFFQHSRKSWKSKDVLFFLDDAFALHPSLFAGISFRRYHLSLSETFQTATFTQGESLKLP